MAKRYNASVVINLNLGNMPAEKSAPNPKPKKGKRRGGVKATERQEAVLAVLENGGAMDKAAIIHGAYGKNSTPTDGRGVTAALTSLLAENRVQRLAHGVWSLA